MALLKLLSLLLASSSIAPGAFAQNITDAYFYGQSPPSYPTPRTNGTTIEWAAAYARAKAFVDQLSNEEKANLTYGAGGALGNTLNGCSGIITSIDRVGFPGMCLSDAGNGLRATTLVSGYPSGIHVGAR